jgi:hypothetical protein
LEVGLRAGRLLGFSKKPYREVGVDFLGRVTVPHPTKDLTKGTYNSILKQAGLK